MYSCLGKLDILNYVLTELNSYLFNTGYSISYRLEIRTESVYCSAGLKLVSYIQPLIYEFTGTLE